jgi:peptidoglycan/xylan/chitin deacetylase (PgdA/CDA1 family)
MSESSLSSSKFAARIPVLCWHKVSPKLEPGITRVSPERFALQLHSLVQEGFRSLSAEEFLERKGLAVQGQKECLLCFDDAYACLVEHALPLMKSLGLTGVLFPALDHIGEDNRWDRGLLGTRFLHMDQTQIEDALGEGWSLGFHGRTHISLRSRDLACFENEILTAARELENRFERPLRLMAWPFGQSDRRSQSLAKTCGFQMAFGSARRPEFDLMDWPRYMIYPLHGPRAIQAFLQGAPRDILQHLAQRGATLSSLLRP